MTISQSPPDIELGHLRDGYPALSTWMARDPDNETFVFRKFDRLGARNILHLQSQLIALETEIDVLDEAARQSNDLEAQQSSRRYETLMKNANDANRPEKKRVEKLNELKGCLKEYHETLILQSQIANFKQPSARVTSTFREYLEGNTLKGKALQAMPIISGSAKSFLSDATDLIALRVPNDQDFLSRFLQNHWAFQKRETKDPFDRTTIYKNQHVVQTVAAISMTLAAILLISAIISLHFVTSAKAKLGLVATYTLLFAVSLALMTNAKRVEVFAATAAYAAVLVVFVSGDLGGSRGEQCLILLENGIFQTVRCPG